MKKLTVFDNYKTPPRWKENAMMNVNESKKARVKSVRLVPVFAALALIVGGTVLALNMNGNDLETGENQSSVVDNVSNGNAKGQNKEIINVNTSELTISLEEANKRLGKYSKQEDCVVWQLENGKYCIMKDNEEIYNVSLYDINTDKIEKTIDLTSESLENNAVLMRYIEYFDKKGFVTSKYKIKSDDNTVIYEVYNEDFELIKTITTSEEFGDIVADFSKIDDGKVTLYAYGNNENKYSISKLNDDGKTELLCQDDEKASEYKMKVTVSDDGRYLYSIVSYDNDKDEKGYFRIYDIENKKFIETSDNEKGVYLDAYMEDYYLFLGNDTYYVEHEKMEEITFENNKFKKVNVKCKEDDVKDDDAILTAELSNVMKINDEVYFTGLDSEDDGKYVYLFKRQVSADGKTPEYVTVGKQKIAADKKIVAYNYKDEYISDLSFYLHLDGWRFDENKNTLSSVILGIEFELNNNKN